MNESGSKREVDTSKTNDPLMKQELLFQRFTIGVLLFLVIAVPCLLIQLGFAPHFNAVLLCSVPLFFRFAVDRTIYGTYSKKARGSIVTRSSDSLLHFVQGLFGAFTFICFLESGSDLSFLRLLLTIAAWFYPLYNISKRCIKRGNYFWESSFYVNHADYTAGLWCGQFLFWLWSRELVFLPLSVFVDSDIPPRLYVAYGMLLFYNFAAAFLGLITRGSLRREIKEEENFSFNDNDDSFSNSTIHSSPNLPSKKNNESQNQSGDSLISSIFGRSEILTDDEFHSRRYEEREKEDKFVRKKSLIQ